MTVHLFQEQIWLILKMVPDANPLQNYVNLARINFYQESRTTS